MADVRDYRAIYQKCVDLAEEWESHLDPTYAHFGSKLAEVLLSEHMPRPKHAARPPHPSTQIGRK